MIYQVIEETTDAIPAIKHFDAGPGFFAESADEREAFASATDKYPMLWMYDIKTVIGGKYVPETTYTIFAYLVMQAEETPEGISQVYSYTDYLAKQWVQALHNHPAVLLDDTSPSQASLTMVPLQILSDHVAGWYITISLKLKEAAITCITPTTTLNYNADGYVNPHYTEEE